MLKRRIGVALVSASLLAGFTGAGLSGAQDPYGGSNQLSACLKKAKKKKTPEARKTAKRRCHKRFG